MNLDHSDGPVIEKPGSVRARVTSGAALTLLMGMLLPGTVTADPLFTSTFLSFEAGAYPRTVAIGDLDADGRLDLVVANYGAGPPGVGSVSVLMGHGDGTFGARTDYGTGSTPYGLAIGDLNADGTLDLAVSNASSNTISVLLGNGDGTFAAHTDFGTGNRPYCVAIGDVNGDGKPDLAASNANSNTISVLIGNGDGTFAAHIEFGVGNGPSYIAIGDVNGDAKPDVAVSNANSNTLSVLLGNGDGSFGPKSDYGTGRDPVSLAIGDLNADGAPDLAVSNANSNTVSVLLGNGDGTFAAQTEFGTGNRPLCVAIGDLSGDGKPDLAASNASSSTVSVLLGNGDGSFGARADSPTGGTPQSVAVGDLNGDGKLDLATANKTNMVSALLGNGDGSFGSETHFATGNWPNSVTIGDLNGDGKPDMVATNNGDNTISVLLGDGQGSFGAKLDYPGGFGIFSAAIGDLNADGKPDLVAAIHGGWPGLGLVAVLLGNGDGSFGPTTVYDAGGNADFVAIGDLNGDGRPDLAIATELGLFGDGGGVGVLLGNGDGTFGATTVFATGGPCVSVAIGDLNADGKPDLATAISPPCQELDSCLGWVSVLLGNGDGNFVTSASYRPGYDPAYSPGYSPGCVAIGDINADGRPDLVVGAGAGLLGNGDGSFGTEFRYGAGGTSVAIGDFNADGRPDLAGANSFSNAVFVVLGNGDGTFSARTDFGAGIFPFSLAIGDLNGDGKVDLATANLRSNTLSVLFNNGPATCPAAPMSFDLTPKTLNLRSMGHWMTGVLEPEPPASPADIEVSTILLNGRVPVDASAPTSIGDADHDGRPDLMVKFDRAAVEMSVEDGDAITVTVTGKIGGGCFEATDVIRIVRGHVRAPTTGSYCDVGSITEVRWDMPTNVRVESVAMLWSSDDGDTWTRVAERVPNSGSYPWTVPNVPTDQARVAVVLAESANADGFEVNGVLGVSERFVITSPLGVSEPRLALALRGSVPNPSRGLSVSFTLPDASPATLLVYDISGREVFRREVGGLGAGRHVLSLGTPRALVPGLYLLKLIQGGHRLVSRAVIAR